MKNDTNPKENKNISEEDIKELQKIGVDHKLKLASIDIHGADIPETPPTSLANSRYPAIWDLVIADMQSRDRMGTEKYHTRLRPFNGRSPLWDAYQEALDMVVYLRQAIYEQEHGSVNIVPKKEL